MVEDNVVRRVVRLADFLQDDAPLPLQLLGRERAVGQDVTDDVGTQRQVFLQQLHVIRRLLTRRVGVDMAAHILDRLGNFGRRTPRGALECHVLEEMRCAVFGRGLVARAGRDVGADRHGLDPVHRLGHDGETAGQPGDLDGLAHAAFLLAKARTRAWMIERSLGAAL